MTQFGYVFIGLTAALAVLIGIITFALLWFAAAARNANRTVRSERSETAVLSAALEDAVSRLKVQEQEMRDRAAASERLSGQIVEHLTAGVLLVNADGTVGILNPAGRHMLDLPADAVGRPYRDVLAAAPPLVEVITESLTTMRPILRRSLRMPGAARTSHLGVTVTPLGTVGTRAGAICLFSDLTNIIELEEQLRLRDSLARLGELTAGIAHEFRNGLATIHGYGRLIDPQALPAAYRPYVEGIRQETEALGGVVTNFLKFARPEQVTLTRIDPEAVARRVTDELQHEMPSGTTMTVTGTFAAIDGDEGLLRQAFGNLVRNAAEACQSAHRVPVITICGTIDHGQRALGIAVEDNGPGIPGAVRDRVFQPFFTTRTRGTGLGLAIVQKIVVLHNGRISVRDSADGGARMQMVFPAAV